MFLQKNKRHNIDPEGCKAHRKMEKSRSMGCMGCIKKGSGHGISMFNLPLEGSVEVNNTYGL